MKNLCLSLLLLAATVLSSTVQAQVINGDLNHNQDLDVEDVTLLIDGYLTGETETVSPAVDPFMEDNSRIVGTWYQTKTNYTTYNADGTFGNMGMEGYTYKFLPFQGRILTFTPDGQMQDATVLYLTDEVMYLRFAQNPYGYNVYYRTLPPQPVNRITLSETQVGMKVDETVQLTAVVYPSDADNTEVVWSSSDENVVTVDKGYVKAVGEGVATITCTAADGSGVQATCSVTVTDHEYVDLGLSVKWATMNVGANAPEEYGDYFAWGETNSKTDYSWENYKWCNGSETTMTKYCTDSDYGTVDNRTTLELSDDAARANWGGTWRIPTHDEFTELRTKCTWEWTSLNGVNGRKVTGPNGNSIFLPAAGYRDDSSLDNAGSSGSYWSSSLSTDDPLYGWYLYFLRSSDFNMDYHSRFDGRSVRAVCQ
ncbi:MAG: Ig-like domain-containing protein [Bacteroidaceae bacterium]|nr:Ig-like domain-containing protein [Bacteroidaceae bacterium]